MKISELPTNERDYYRKLYVETELIVGGYENIIQDGGETDAPTVELVAAEAIAEVEIRIRNMSKTHLHFIGKERMDELAMRAAKRSIANSMFAQSRPFDFAADFKADEDASFASKELTH